ncbi:hypothetical protein ACET6F_13550 [Aeromonas veronii]
MPLHSIKTILEKNKCICIIDNSSLEIEFDGIKNTIEIEPEWTKVIKSFNRSNQYSFDGDTRRLIGPKSIEIGVSRLNGSAQYMFTRTNYTFKNTNNRIVNLSLASDFFALSFFFSQEYSDFFNVNISRKLKNKRIRTFNELLWRPYSITFSAQRKTDTSKLLSEGIPALDACLFKLASELGSCWEFMKKRRERLMPEYEDIDTDNMSIPMAKYDPNMLKYFKVAVSSQFPSQSYLSYYHVLEYNFLSVSDEVLHSRVKTHIHSTEFNGSNTQIEKIINIIKKHNDKSDETEMLTRVLRKYINEDELIDFIEELENRINIKLYTKTADVFGEKLQIQTKKDHAISNTAKVLKHIRNALVHSSDRYNRDDCHIPLTESEFVIEKYIPLISFLAEKVICATSS